MRTSKTDETDYATKLIREAEKIFNDELCNLFFEKEYDEYAKISEKLENLKLTNSDILSDEYFDLYEKYFSVDALEGLAELKNKINNIGTNRRV